VAGTNAGYAIERHDNEDEGCDSESNQAKQGAGMATRVDDSGTIRIEDGHWNFSPERF
jgi:hypothetical protein